MYTLTLPTPSTSTSAPLAPLSPRSVRKAPALEDISHVTLERRREILREAARAPDASKTLFLLDTTSEALRERLHDITTYYTDLDGTVAKGPHIHATALPLLRSLRSYVTTVALTGRPHDEVLPLYKKNEGDPGFDVAIGEAGASVFCGEGGKDVRYLLSNPAIEEQATAARATMESILSTVVQRHFLTHKPMGFGGHKSMGAWQFFQKEGVRMQDIALHDRLMAEVMAEARTALASVGIVSSGTGSLEISVDPNIHKAAAIRAYNAELQQRITTTAFSGDSGNDQSVFSMQEPPLLHVVADAHTPDALVDRAHVATAGYANAAPFLRVLLQEKRRGARRQEA